MCLYQARVRKADDNETNINVLIGFLENKK